MLGVFRRVWLCKCLELVLSYYAIIGFLTRVQIKRHANSAKDGNSQQQIGNHHQSKASLPIDIINKEASEDIVYVLSRISNYIS